MCLTVRVELQTKVFSIAKRLSNSVRERIVPNLTVFRFFMCACATTHFVARIPFLLPWALWQGFKAILLLFLTLSIHSNGSNSLSRNPFVLPFQLVEVVLWFPTTISTILKGEPGSYWDYVVSTLRDAIERGGTVAIVRPLARFNWIYSSYELCNHPVGAREWTALHQAVALAKSDTNGAVDGDDDDAKNAARIELVYFLVHTCRTKVEAVDQPSQQTALHLAISRNNLKLVKCLVQDCRANLYATDKSGTTCLQYACRHGTVAMVRFLLESTCKRGSLAVTP